MTRLFPLKNLEKTLKNRPLLVGTLVGTSPLVPQIHLAKKACIDLLELRLDTFPQIFQKTQDPLIFSEQVIADISERLPVPLLLTLRSHKEAGKRLPRAQQKPPLWRRHLLTALLPYVDLIDVEIQETKFAAVMTRRARRKGVGVIHSYHDFHSPGRWPRIKKLSGLSKKMGGDIFKLAVTPKTQAGAMDFLSRGAALSNPHKVLIAMGKKGTVSRFLGFSFSSLLTYGHLGRLAAPGQISAADLAKSIRHVYGK